MAINPIKQNFYAACYKHFLEALFGIKITVQHKFDVTLCLKCV